MPPIPTKCSETKMGILHSISRFLLGCKKTEYEEGERPLLPHPTLHRRQQNNQYAANCDSSERSPKITIFLSLTHKAIKGILQKFRFIIFYLPRVRKTAENPPILPIKNPEPTKSNEPLLSGDSTTQDSDNACVTSSQHWPPETNDSATGKETAVDHVIVSVPDFTYSLSDTSVSDEITNLAAFVEGIAPQNVPFAEERGKEEREDVEEVITIKSGVVVDEGRWIKHYSSRHRILLVGEGDFSFSACLAVEFGCASNMIATSLNSEAFLKKNYQNAPSNIEELRSRECKVLHGIDATEMANHALLRQLKFDRIIFNFPFAGFFRNLSQESQLRRHRRLVSLFLKNAREMLTENGEIHISHKTNGVHVEWKLESIASSHKLRLIEAVKFKHMDYPGYNTKYGFGGDGNFNCYPSKTYKFGLKEGSA